MLKKSLVLALIATTSLPGIAVADELAEGFAEADVNGDGALNADEYLAAIVTSFAVRDTDQDGLLTAAELPEATPEGLARIDRNGDGMISVGEAAGDRIVRFFDADTDRNGLLTLDELRRYVEALEEETSE
jgi:Ca2+-binding EF-hand superfamily protein